MIKRINDVDINYTIYGKKGAQSIVLLHGWGQNIEMMKPIGNAFQEQFQIIIIDLPGHGNSTEPPYAWNVEEFVEAIHTLLEDHKIKNPILIGHSFGGKISLLYSSKYSVKKMVLLASPFKKEIKKLSTKTKILKQLKKVPVLNKMEQFAKKRIGSEDYRNATPKMREILVNTVNLDITEEVKKINCPTLIIWGTQDTEVPVERAYELEQIIPDAGVVIYEGCTHYAYLERLEQTLSVLNVFLKEE